MNLTNIAPQSDDGGRVVAAAVTGDMCMEILLRLPTKSVTKFQIVSKEWLSLISSDHFRRLHTLRHHKPPPCLILPRLESNYVYFNLITKTTTKIPFSTKIHNHPQTFPIFSSPCHGLVLLRDDPHCYVYNLITNQSRKLSLPHCNKYSFIQFLHLVFDPSKSFHYKIVCIRAQGNPPLHMQITSFNSARGTWNDCRRRITVSSELDFTTSVYCNNRIYGRKLIRDGSVFCIDIDKNVLRFLKCPYLPSSSYSESIQESNGYLYYAALCSGHSACLWEKSKGDDNWLLKYDDRVPFYSSWFDSPLLRFIADTSTLLISVPPRKIMAYSFLHKTYTELLDLHSLQIPYNDRSMRLFHETLAPV